MFTPLQHFSIVVMILHFNNVAWAGNGGRVNYYVTLNYYVAKWIRIQSCIIFDYMEISRTINLLCIAISISTA